MHFTPSATIKSRQTVNNININNNNNNNNNNNANLQIYTLE